MSNAKQTLARSPPLSAEIHLRHPGTPQPVKGMRCQLPVKELNKPHKPSCTALKALVAAGKINNCPHKKNLPEIL